MTNKTRIAHYSAIGLFGLFGVQGIWGSLNQMAKCDTLGKSLQTLALFGYGVVGLVIAFLALKSRAPSRVVQIIWSTCIVLAAGLAPSQWGNAPIFASVVSALAAAVIVAGGLWLLRAAHSVDS